MIGWRFIPGLVVLVVVGGAASLLATRVPYGNALVFTVIIGALLANIFEFPEWTDSGINLHTRLLEVGIILLGAQIDLQQVLRAGPSIVALALGTVLVGIVIVELLSRQVFGLPSRTSSLLAAGSSICGVSAVAAVAGSIDAREDEIAYAAATILIFDAVTLIAFPLIGKFLGLPGKLFGLWAGLSMFSTGPVAAAGFAYSDVAGEWATMTKLVRNSFIGLAAIIYSLMYSVRRREEHRQQRTGTLRELCSGFPKFILAFLAVMLLVNLGVIPAAVAAQMQTGSNWLFLLAFAGLGFDIKVAKMRDAGISPLLTVLTYLVIISCLTLSVASILI